MNLIDDVSEKIEAELKKLWPYQGQTEFVRARQNAQDQARFEEIGALPEDSPERAAKIAEGEKLLAGERERGKLTREVSYAVSDQLCRLTPDTYPRDEADTPHKMHAFLRAFSHAYAKAGKQSSAYMMLEYVRSADYDHWCWLWREWIAACVAVEDFTSAESLIAAATDGGTSAAHHYNVSGGKHKPALMVAKAMIALHRDGDLAYAHQIANNARLTFGDSHEAVSCYRAITYMKQEVDAGRLKLEMHLGPNGVQQPKIVERVAPPAALLTGKWNQTSEDDES